MSILSWKENEAKGEDSIYLYKIYYNIYLY